jgi:hypothetical protein
MTRADQIACVRREIEMRQRVYPRWVEAGRMTMAKARIEIETMQSVLKTLEHLHETERLI